MYSDWLFFLGGGGEDFKWPVVNIYPIQNNDTLDKLQKASKYNRPDMISRCEIMLHVIARIHVLNTHRIC